MAGIYRLWPLSIYIAHPRTHTLSSLPIYTCSINEKRKTVSYRATELRLSGQAELESDRIEAENEVDDSINQVFSRGGCQLEQDSYKTAFGSGSLVPLCHMISLTLTSVLQQGRARSRISFSMLPGGASLCSVQRARGIVYSQRGAHGRVNEVLCT